MISIINFAKFQFNAFISKVSQLHRYTFKRFIIYGDDDDDGDDGACISCFHVGFASFFMLE